MFVAVCCVQTIANFYLAFEQDLVLLPVMNKVDLPSAEPEAVAAQMAAAFDVTPHEVGKKGGKDRRRRVGDRQRGKRGCGKRVGDGGETWGGGRRETGEGGRHRRRRGRGDGGNGRAGGGGGSGGSPQGVLSGGIGTLL